MMFKKNSIVIVIAFLIISSCATSPQTTVEKPSGVKTAALYKQLGEYEGIDSVVVELIHVLAKDERVRNRFKGVNMDKFRKGLADYICSAAEGPCHYSGDSLKQIHAGYSYTDTEFNAIVANLITAMERKNVPVAAQNQLLKLLAPSYKDIIYQ